MKTLSTLIALSALFVLPAFAQEGEACKPIPTFKLTATDGKTYDAKALSSKATVVIFLSNGCPHNPKAMPDFNRFRKQLGSQVQVVGFINTSLPGAKQMAKQLGSDFPLIADPNGKVMKSFGAGHSLDIAMICPKDKMVAKLWEGYNQSIFKEIVDDLPMHGGPTLKLDVSSYPKARQSGCGF